MKKHKVTVTSITYSPDKQSYVIYMCTAQSINYKAGQFVIIEANIGNKIIRRAYSILCDPYQYQQQNILSLYIKKVAGGIMSNYLCDSINIGDELTLIGPGGNMFYRPNIDTNHILAISTGSGVAPILSICSELSGQNKNIVHLFGEKNTNSLHPDLIEVIKKPYDIQTYILLSRQTDAIDMQYNLNIYKGHVQDYIDTAILQLSNRSGIAPNDIYLHLSVFLCGQPSMVDELRSILTDRGIDPKYIQFEKY